MKSLALVLLLLSGCSPAPLSPAAQDTQVTVALVQDLGEGVLPVCGATWINEHWLLTANHCVTGDALDKEAPVATIEYITEPIAQVRRTAETVYRDEKHDLALLYARAAPPHPVALIARDVPALGSNIHVMGHPQGMLFTYLRGTLAQHRSDFPGISDMLQVQVPITPGSSGGGAFDDEGHLVGVADKFVPRLPGEGFFVPVESIHAFMAASGFR